MAKRKTPVEPVSEWILSAEQSAAVDWLVGGKTISETARALEVPVQAVQEWCRTHPGVQAELHAQRQERWMGTTDRLRALLPQALEVLAEELQGENRLQAAVHVLKACRLYGAEWPAGPTEAADIVVAEKEHVQNRQRRLRLANLY